MVDNVKKWCNCQESWPVLLFCLTNKSQQRSRHSKQGFLAKNRWDNRPTTRISAVEESKDTAEPESNISDDGDRLIVGLREEAWGRITSVYKCGKEVMNEIDSSLCLTRRKSNREKKSMIKLNEFDV